MAFFIIMFICNLLIPAIMVIAGYWLYKNPPKKINGWIGYRTNVTLIVQAVQVIILIASIVPVEKALRRTFDEKGNRR